MNKRRSARKLQLKRLTVSSLTQPVGGYQCVSYEARCSGSCHTCDVNNWTCYIIDDTDFCETNVTNGCPSNAMPGGCGSGGPNCYGG